MDNVDQTSTPAPFDWDARMTTDIRPSRVRNVTPYARRSSANRRDDLVRKSQQKKGHKARVLDHLKKRTSGSGEYDSQDTIITCTRTPTKATPSLEDEWEMVHRPDNDAGTGTTLLHRVWHWMYCH